MGGSLYQAWTQVKSPRPTLDKNPPTTYSRHHHERRTAGPRRPYSLAC